MCTRLLRFQAKDGAGALGIGVGWRPPERKRKGMCCTVLAFAVTLCPYRWSRGHPGHTLCGQPGHTLSGHTGHTLCGHTGHTLCGHTSLAATRVTLFVTTLATLVLPPHWPHCLRPHWPHPSCSHTGHTSFAAALATRLWRPHLASTNGPCARTQALVHARMHPHVHVCRQAPVHTTRLPIRNSRAPRLRTLEVKDPIAVLQMNTGALSTGAHAHVLAHAHFCGRRSI